MIKQSELKTYAELMKTRFMEDPGVIFQVKDLDRAELLIKAQFEGQIEAFMEENAVQVLARWQGSADWLLNQRVARRPSDERDAAIISKITGAGEPGRIAGASGPGYLPGPDHSSKLAYYTW